MENSNIINVSENDFESKVIEASENKLIIVDFWAPWCGPCKQLTPIMEKVAKENQDGFILVKINIDENQQIASQLRIQSIPTVYAFWEKKIVNAFQGVISEKDFINFIEKSSGKKLKEDMSAFYNEIKELISKKEIKSAKEKILDFLTDNSGDNIVVSLYLECLLIEKDFREIDDFLTSLDEEMRSSKEVNTIVKKIKIVKDSKKSESIESIVEKFNQNPNNVKLLFEISDFYFSEADYERAFLFLLENYSIDKEKIKKKLLSFFEALGNEHEATKIYRKKLSSLLFS